MDRIAKHLYQGSEPNTVFPPRINGEPFDVLILCAEEYQPVSGFDSRTRLVHAPNDDSFLRPLTRQQIVTAARAAKLAASALRCGKTVLVTCHMGLNRSGLVSAMTLHLVYGCSGIEAVKRVKEKRCGALFNKRFVEFLEKIPAKV
jgi:protein-tyrosine phosphatase